MCLVAALALAGCGADVAAPGPGGQAAGAGGGPGGPLGNAGSTGSHKGLPVVAITSPQTGTVITSDRVALQGTARGEQGIASVFVKVGPNLPVAAQSNDGFRTWSLEAPAPPYAFEVSATAYDMLGRAPERPARISLGRKSDAPDGSAPSVFIDSPEDGATPAQALALVRGRSEDDRGVVRMEALRDGEVIAGREVETSDFYRTWSMLVPLVPGKASDIVFAAVDEGGRRGEAHLKLVGPSAPDNEAPALALTSPAQGQAFSSEAINVTGTAFDQNGVLEVKVRVGVPGAAPSDVAWGAYVKATTINGYAAWSADLALPPGAARVQARATDANGLASVVERSVTNDYTPQWSEEIVAPLRVRDEPRPELTMGLDKAGVNKIINADLQKSIELLKLDSLPLLNNIFGQIKTACGTGWQADSADPHHDCSLTPLGQTFHGPDGTWQTSPEYALVRVLTMTPANVVVDGTSIEGLKGVANFIGLGGGFNQILAETLGIPRTTEIVGTANVAESMRRNLLATHPALAPDGRLPITLYDAMNDLAPLGQKLGPAGGHPGVVDPASPPHGAVLLPTFKMTLKALSNLRWKDGVVLDQGKEYMAVIDDPSGQNQPLSFNFVDPAKFQVDGLASAPKADLRVKVQENPAFINSCVGQSACKNNLPGSPVGAGSLWATPPWQLEHLTGFAARTQYQNRTFDKCYLNLLGCQARVEVGQNGDPPGWTHFTVIFNIGNPPKDQYVWELISEVAQVALHRYSGTTAPEGTANVAFPLKDVPVGVTADQIRAAMRPSLQAQAAELADGLLGDYAKNNAPLDFFYDLGADGKPYLYFVAPSDPRPEPGYAYERPGFFSSPTLAPDSKLSRLTINGSGDSAHEKLALTPGDITVYAQDQAGQVYRLRLTLEPGPSPQVRVAVARRLAP